MNLSKHFTLAEFTHSQTAERAGIDNAPNDEQRAKITILCVNVLEPVREHFGLPVRIDSGFRSQALNAIVPNSSNTSQHSLGEAADIVIPGVELMDVFGFIKDNLEFDQVIFELTWVHVSFRLGKNRKQVLRAKFTDGKVSYIPWREDET